VDDITVAGAVILLILTWYGVIRLAGRLRPPQWQASMVWCARMKCMSLIETEQAQANDKSSLAICRCFLWPELRDCDQRCVR
jgi:hypothetical protein